ncbi:MAG: DUF1840 domain-containing protein [Betaproteobacteria bacterium HGW-Betaproteobacteria-7]|jgi:hypothetical protein|nr:MAG: DUF1840 domain-containing protein [Betaproteobacteria bacterium HGW-Betaproteobacteria-7]
MLITFKSPASSDVMMFGDVAERMMTIIGKDIAAKGIVTVEYLPAAIAKLKAAINTDTQAENESEPNGDDGKFVGIAQRALPLVELFESSLKQEVPVVWGV